jgi:superfamily I DNA/RNA helicase
MAVRCADWKTMALCTSTLIQRKLPHRVRKKSGEYQPGAATSQMMTIKISNGRGFPLVAPPVIGHIPAPGEHEKEATRVFYVAATQRLLVSASAEDEVGLRLQK